jgi:hypothetical protein
MQAFQGAIPWPPLAVSRSRHANIPHANLAVGQETGNHSILAGAPLVLSLEQIKL